MWRLTLRIVLCFLVYIVSLWIIGEAANAVAYLMEKGGSPELWRILHQHPFGRSIAVGFVAGLIPLRFLFSVSGFFRSDIPEFFRRLDLEKMKQWIVLLVSPVAVADLTQWISNWFAMHSKTVTALQEGSSMHLSQIFDGFFSDNCRNISDIRIDLWSDNFAYQCMLHVTQVSIFLTAVAYSLAPWVKQQLLKQVAIDHPAPLDSSSEEEEIHITTSGKEKNQ